MGCSHVAPGHWVGALVLLFGFGLSALGVASPWWRAVQEPGLSRREGLWEVCVSRRKEDAHCEFSSRHSGLWRTVQILKLTSLLFLTCGLISSVIRVNDKQKRKREKRHCPASSVGALAGGLAGFVADLLYVGYTEFHSDRFPGEHVYYWSFALAVSGSVFSLFAALVLCLSAFCCTPRFTSYVAEPYWPYRHYRIGLDENGRAYYYPYPGPYLSDVKEAWAGEARLKPAIDSRQKQRELGKQRNHHVRFSSQEPSSHALLVDPQDNPPQGYESCRQHEQEPWRFHPNIVVPKVASNLNSRYFSTSDSSNSNNVEKPADLSDSSRTSQPPQRLPPCLQPNGETDVNGPTDDSGLSFLSDSNQRFYQKHVHNPLLHDKPPKRHVNTEQNGDIFTIERAMSGFRERETGDVGRGGERPHWTEPSGPGEYLVWQPAGYPPPRYLPQKASRPLKKTEPHRLWSPWVRRPRQEGVVIETGRKKFWLD